MGRRLTRLPQWTWWTFAGVAAFSYVWAFYVFFVEPFGFRWRAVFGDPSYPKGYSVHGIDISHHQGKIDWTKLSNAMVDRSTLAFIMVKATEGSNYLDDCYEENFRKAKEYGFIRNNGRIFTKNGINKANFVIDKNGQLHLGNGHSYLAHGEPVQAAGTIKIGSGGIPRRITNLSGHYQPNVKETVHYLDTMHKNGYISNRTWVDIYSFDKSKSGYVTKVKTVYSGPYQYLNRRFSK